MTSYEIIDVLCDSINPTLFILTVLSVVVQFAKGENKKATVVAAFLVFGLMQVYGILYIDTQWEIWSAFGGDYSTHTAFAVVVCLALSLCVGRKMLLTGVLLVYILLMLYQQYHTLLDIVTTAAVVGIAVLPGMITANRFLGGVFNARSV